MLVFLLLFAYLVFFFFKDKGAFIFWKRFYLNVVSTENKKENCLSNAEVNKASAAASYKVHPIVHQSQGSHTANFDLATYLPTTPYPLVIDAANWPPPTKLPPHSCVSKNMAGTDCLWVGRHLLKVYLCYQNEAENLPVSFDSYSSNVGFSHTHAARRLSSWFSA